MDSENKKTRRKLHYVVRKEGYNLVTSERTIYVPYTQTEFSDSIKQLLLEFGYVIQLQIV